MCKRYNSYTERMCSIFLPWQSSSACNHFVIFQRYIQIHTVLWKMCHHQIYQYLFECDLFMWIMGIIRFNRLSGEFLGRYGRFWLTALCHKIDYQWLIYWQVAHAEIIIQRAVGFICHLFNVSSLYSYVFSAWGIIMKHLLSLFLE